MFWSRQLRLTCTVRRRSVSHSALTRSVMPALSDGYRYHHDGAQVQLLEEFVLVELRVAADDHDHRG